MQSHPSGTLPRPAGRSRMQSGRRGRAPAETNLDLTDCARLGGLAAAEVIGHFGARPQADPRDLARQEGLLP